MQKHDRIKYTYSSITNNTRKPITDVVIGHLIMKRNF